MVRPREFDRELALEKAMRVFWAKGFGATSTEDLLDAMGIGRQSLYNAFGDKRQLYIEAMRLYQQQATSGHLGRLTGPASPLEGIRALLVGLVPEDEALLCLGCMGVAAIGEFGTTDPELVAMREADGPLLRQAVLSRIREGQASGEIDPSIKASTATDFVQAAMMGLQVQARAGATGRQLQEIARFFVARLEPKPSAARAARGRRRPHPAQ